jgi:hypothetical protein
MNIINQDQKRLDNIAAAYWRTSGEMRQMWGKKWYALIKKISMRLDAERRNDESKRLTTNLGKIY